jgi:LysR family glycine cleavage system transcriptional activator
MSFFSHYYFDHIILVQIHDFGASNALVNFHNINKNIKIKALSCGLSIAIDVGRSKKIVIMSIQTPIRGLRSFCIASKCLSFKHAASQLFLTPSAVSHQIKQLEAQLGIALFKRGTRTIELTSAGKQFYQSIQPIIHQLESTITEFTQKQQNQTIVISLPEFFASELFIPSLSLWSENNPNINLQLETVKSSSEQSQSADLSIVLANGKPNANIVHELFPIRYAPACNKRLYKKLKTSGFSALKSTPLILHSSRPWSWHQWADKVAVDDFDPKQIIQFDSMFGVARAAQQGMGIALVPLPMSKTWFSEQLLVKLFDEELNTNDKYYLIQHENMDNRAELALFAEWVKATFAI